MTTPTLEQQEEMARWLGILREHNVVAVIGVVTLRGCSYCGEVEPVETRYCPLPDFTDLSTMFRYVIIPKQINYRLESFQDEHLATVWIDEFLSENSAFVGDESPGLALFWACYELLKEAEDGRE